MTRVVYRLSFNQVLFLMLAICAAVFIPGMLVLAFGASIVSQSPARLSIESLTSHFFMVASTIVLVTCSLVWYADWAFPLIMRTFAALLERVQLTDPADEKAASNSRAAVGNS